MNQSTISPAIYLSPSHASASWDGLRGRRYWIFVVAIAAHVALLILLNADVRTVSIDVKAIDSQAARVTIYIPPKLKAEPQQTEPVSRNEVLLPRSGARASVKTSPKVRPANNIGADPPTLTVPATTGDWEVPDSNPHGDAIDRADEVANFAREAARLGQDRSITGEMPADRLMRADSEIEKFRKDVKKAERPDCRTRYAGLGPLAIPFIVENTVTGTGCKW